MKKTKIQQIEEEINYLTQKRAELFNEWAYLVKKNDRDYELKGDSSPHLVKKADSLLQEQRSIGKKIMKLLEKADSLTMD